MHALVRNSIAIILYMTKEEKQKSEKLNAYNNCSLERPPGLNAFEKKRV